MTEQRYTFFAGRRGEKRERTIMAVMDAILDGKTVHIASPNREQADAIYAEAKARIASSRKPTQGPSND